MKKLSLIFGVLLLTATAQPVAAASFNNGTCESGEINGFANKGDCLPGSESKQPVVTQPQPQGAGTYVPPKPTAYPAPTPRPDDTVHIPSTQTPSTISVQPSTEPQTAGKNEPARTYVIDQAPSLLKAAIDVVRALV